MAVGLAVVGATGVALARRRRGLPAVRRLVAATALVAGAVAVSSPGPPTPAASPTPAAVPVVLAPGTGRPSPEPVGLRIPAVGVDAALDRLGLDPAGALVPPAIGARAGWYTGSPAPGDVGPAVLAGHVDSRSGPAVFWRLRELAPGDEVVVDRADGTSVRFTVTAVERAPKARFPTAAVYGPTPRAELRLVTCGGDFDRSAGSYPDNVVVTAVAA
ncbi:class F sortase [Geodermatophilus sp. CPCC 206100]|uniref:class F sortase n=1 Tax=Geodermatophilus sp. CPCC 206100 TaxID=3020054 RepID=UPI003B00027B